MGSLEWSTRQWQLVRPYARQLYYALRPDRRPDYFQKPWTYPVSLLEAGSQCLPAAGQFVCFFLPMSDWHARIQRSQQLAKSIAQSGRQSVYVNPHLGLEYSRPYFFDPHSKIA